VQFQDLIGVRSQKVGFLQRLTITVAIVLRGVFEKEHVFGLLALQLGGYRSEDAQEQQENDHERQKTIPNRRLTAEEVSICLIVVKIGFNENAVEASTI